MASRVLNVDVTADVRDYVRQLGRAGGATDRMAKSSGRLHKGLRDIGHGAAYALGAGGFGGGMYALFDITKKSISEFRESERVTRQTTAALKSTGGAANVTAKHVSDLANAIKRKTAIDDESIQAAENMLLTFTGVRNETGKGNKIFDQATQSVTDMATAMSGGATPSAEKLRTTAILVGKALNDPIRGSTALRRVGVALTEQQRAQIKTLEEHGHHLEAQKIILRELTTEFGGSAAKQKTAAKELQTALGDLAETAGRYLAPKITDVSKKAARFIEQMQDGRGAGGRFADKMRDVASAVGKVVGVVVDVGKWLGKHPALLKAAGAAWVTYKALALTNIAIVKAAELGLFGAGVRRKMVAEAAATGAASGKALGGAGALASARASGKILGAAALAGVIFYLQEHEGDTRPIWDRILNPLGFGGTGNQPKGINTKGTKPIGPGKYGGSLHFTPPDARGNPRSPGHGVIRPHRRGKTASVVAHASGEAGGQELGSLQRAAAWVNANYGPGVGTLLEDSGGGNQHLHIEGPESTVVAIGKALQRQGFSVGENPAFGGVHPVHSHGGLPGIPGDHYSGNAIDVNADNRSLGAPSGGSRGGRGGTANEKVRWRDCVLTWYDPALGGTNSGTGRRDAHAPTASGELYNPSAFTCAAPSGYSFGTIITFAYGGRVVSCKVNDRGGAITGHHFDLSRAAAATLGIMGAGRAKAKFTLSGHSKSIKKAKTPYESLENRLGYIGLEAEAGVISEGEAAEQTIATINRALPNLRGSNRLRALGLRRTAKQQLPKRIRPKVDTTLNNPWLQAFLDHQDNLEAAGQIDSITARENKAAAIERAIGHGLTGEDALRARGMVNDLRGQNFDEISGRTVAPDQVDSVADEGVRLAHIDAQVRAGDLTPEQGRQAKIASIQDALANWVLTDDARLDLRGELKDLLDENTQAQADNTQALKDLQKSIDDQTNFAKSVASTEAAAMAQWVTEVISKQMGFNISGRGQTPGYGVARRS